MAQPSNDAPATSQGRRAVDTETEWSKPLDSHNCAEQDTRLKNSNEVTPLTMPGVREFKDMGIAPERMPGVRELKDMRIASEHDLTQINQATPISLSILLHYYARMNQGGTVKRLLDEGVMPGFRDLEGNTAWDRCCGNRCTDAVGAFAVKEMEYQYPKRMGTYFKDGNQYIGQELNRVLFQGPNSVAIREIVIDNDPSWFHVSGNIRLWIWALLREICGRRKDINDFQVYSFESNTFFERHLSIKFLSVREAFCSFESITTKRDEDTARGARQEFISLVMPYVYCDLLSDLEERRSKYEKLNQGSKYCCHGSSETNSRNTFGVHFPLSLDEYCTPALNPDTLNSRNEAQVLVRYQMDSNENLQEQKVPPTTRLISVHQAWLWKIDNQVITAYPDQIRDNYHLNQWDGGMFDPSIEDIGCLLSLLIDAIDHPSLGNQSETIFNIFAKSIITLSEKVKQYLTAAEINNMNIDKEMEYFGEIDNIRKELSMLKLVLFQQEKVWKDYTLNVWPQKWKDGRFVVPTESKDFPGVEPGLVQTSIETWRTIGRPQTQFEKFNKEIERLDQSAERVEKSISINLDLKQKHASLKEAHSTAIMSAAVFGFTIITIIFTPLTFVVALFALPIDRLQDKQEASRWTDQAGMYSTNYIGKWIVTAEIVSLVITLTAIWLAVELGLNRASNLRKLWNKIKGKSVTNPTTGGAGPSGSIRQPGPVNGDASQSGARETGHVGDSDTKPGNASANGAAKQNGEKKTRLVGDRRIKSENVSANKSDKPQRRLGWLGSNPKDVERGEEAKEA